MAKKEGERSLKSEMAAQMRSYRKSMKVKQLLVVSKNAKASIMTFDRSTRAQARSRRHDVVPGEGGHGEPQRSKCDNKMTKMSMTCNAVVDFLMCAEVMCKRQTLSVGWM